jgi:hypothetical protein
LHWVQWQPWWLLASRFSRQRDCGEDDVELIALTAILVLSLGLGVAATRLMLSTLFFFMMRQVARSQSATVPHLDRAYM